MAVIDRPDAPGSAPRRRRRLVRGTLLTVAVLVLVAVVVLMIGFRRQTVSYVTRWKGPPEETVAWTPLPEAELHLVIAGDTGDSGRRLDANAAAMADLASRSPVDDLWLLGDCVYPDGDPDRLQETVFDPFGPLLDQGVGLMAILGNHDVLTGEGDELMADLGMPARWWAREEGDVLLVGLDSTSVDDPDQLAWLEETLAGTDATWKIVAVHHPPYSAGYQGSDDEVRAAFAPVFARHGVQLVVSGHDHDYQRSKPLKGVTYVVSGAGSGARRTSSADFTAESFSWLHFLELGVYPDRMVVRAVGGDPRALEMGDEFELRP